MADKKSTSRIIDEMSETMRGLHRYEVLTTKELSKFARNLEEKTKHYNGFDRNETTKSQTSE
jgi:hypothetical protein